MWRIVVWARGYFLFFWSQKAGLLHYPREQSYSDKLALAGWLRAAGARSRAYGARRTRPAAPALPVLTAAARLLAALLGRSRQQLRPRPDRADIASATRSPRVPCRHQTGRAGDSLPVLQFFSSSAFFLLKTVLGCAPRRKRYVPPGRSALPAVPSGSPQLPHLNPCSLWQACPGRERGREGKAAASCRALVGRASCLRPRAAAAVGLPGGASCFGHPGRALPTRAAVPASAEAEVQPRNNAEQRG